MPQIKVIRPTEVFARQCDAPDCDEICDSAFPDMPGDNPWTSGTVSEGCNWIAIPSTFRTKHDYRLAASKIREFSSTEPLYFCEFLCLASWAQAQALESGEITGTMATVAV